MATDNPSGHVYFTVASAEKLFAPRGIDANAVIEAYTGHGVRHLLVRNCVTAGSSASCDIGDCPLGQRSECVRFVRNVRMIEFRPAPGSDEDEMRQRFPGDKVPAIRGFVNGCPHSAVGATVHIVGIVLVHGGTKGGNEVAMTGDFVSLFTDIDHPENVLTEELLGAFTSPPREAVAELQKWEGLIVTERKILASIKKGIRYFARRFDGERHTVAVTVGIPCGMDEDDFFWEWAESVCVEPLGNSSDEWEFCELSSDECRERRIKKARIGVLGHLVASTGVGRTAELDVALAGSPLGPVRLIELEFAVDDRQLAKFAKLPDTSPASFVSFMEENAQIPDVGFLHRDTIAEEALISRQYNALRYFSANGAAAAPRLGEYIFDVSKVLMPERKSEQIEFHTPDLNDDQKSAVRTIMAAPELALLQAPPGTGKTTLIAECVYQCVKRGQRVLVCSQSKVAVDNALEYLPHTPEIRAVHVQRDEDRSEGDIASPFTRNHALGNFYSTLGMPAEARLAAWGAIEDKSRKLKKLLSTLEDVEERLRLEDAELGKLNEQRVRLVTELTKTEAARNEAFAAARTKGVLEDVRAFVMEGKPFDVPDVFEFFPDEAFTVFEQSVLGSLLAFERIGARFVSPAYDTTATVRERLAVMRRAFAAARRFVEEGLSLVGRDARRLASLSGEAVLSADDAQRAADLYEEEKAFQTQRDKADADGDEAAYRKFDAARREAMRKRLEIEREGGLSRESYGFYFNTSASDGIDVAAFVGNPRNGRTAVLERLNAIIGDCASLVLRFKQARDAFANDLEVRAEAIVPAKDAGRTLGMLRGRLAELDERLDAARSLCQSFTERRDVAARALAGVVGGDPADAASVRRAAEEALEAITRSLVENADDMALLRPILKRWHSALAKPTEADQERVRPAFERGCNVVGITLTANRNLLDEVGGAMFDVVFIDEVSKATVLEILMGMMCAPKAVLVGDHRQLPPLFMMQDDDSISSLEFNSARELVENSYFKSTYENADTRIKASLLEQYRMHPDIMTLTNHFYEGRLRCGLGAPDEDRATDILPGRVPWLRDGGHVVWIDTSKAPDGSVVEDRQPGLSSYENPLEAYLVVRCLEDLDRALEGVTDHTGAPIRKTVAVISFYARQKKLLRRTLRGAKFGHLELVGIDVVDRFQGGQADYVLVSFARNKCSRKRLGRTFMAKPERINVALSRARSLLVVLGASRMLEACPVSLPPLDHPGEPTEQPVYRRIVDGLKATGDFVQADAVIGPEEWRRVRAA